MHRFHGNQLHVFWHNSDHTRINHEVITVSIDGTLPERGPTDSRVFRDNPRYPMTTACSAGPYVGFDTPLFLACGYTAFGGSTFYGVAAYPGGGWGAWGTVRVSWEDAGGGTSLPSLGLTGDATVNPIMLLSFSRRFCPRPDRNALPDPICFVEADFIITTQWHRGGCSWGNRDFRDNPCQRSYAASLYNPP